MTVVLGNHVAAHCVRVEPRYAVEVVDLAHGRCAEQPVLTERDGGHRVEVGVHEDGAHTLLDLIQPNLGWLARHDVGVEGLELEPRSGWGHDACEHTALVRTQGLSATAVDDLVVASFALVSV